MNYRQCLSHFLRSLCSGTPTRSSGDPSHIFFTVGGQNVNAGQVQSGCLHGPYVKDEKTLFGPVVNMGEGKSQVQARILGE